MIATTRVEVALGGTVVDVALDGTDVLVGVVGVLVTVGVTGVDVFVGVFVTVAVTVAVDVEVGVGGFVQGLKLSLFSGVAVCSTRIELIPPRALEISNGPKETMPPSLPATTVIF